MSRRGVSFVAAIVGLLLTGVLLQLAWTLLDTQRRAVHALVRGGEATEASRLIRSVLHAELRAGRSGADWRAGTDSVVLRGFRGLALPCGPPGDGEIPVRYRGTLRPAPGTDSVLVLGIDGRWSAGLLAGASPRSDPCLDPSAGSPGQWWRLEPTPPARPVLLRLFRVGSYHLADGTLRFRRGAGGRQPLTSSVLDDAGSGLTPGPEGRVRLRLHFRDLPATPGLNPAATTLWPGNG